MDAMDALCDHFRPLREAVAIRPPVKGQPWDISLRDPLPTDTTTKPLPYVWKIMTLPVPWVDKNGKRLLEFPLAVAVLPAPLAGGQNYLLTIHSLFKLLRHRRVFWTP